MSLQVDRTRDVMILMIRSLRKKGIKVNMPPVSKIKKKQLSGYWSYLQQLERGLK